MYARPDSARNIAVFTTPAGISSGLKDTRPGHWLPFGPTLQHWGILVFDDAEPVGNKGTFFELNNPNGRNDVLRRSWQERVEEERCNSTKMMYQDTGFLTTLDDDEIETQAKKICSVHMKGSYNFINGNCQTMVNLLVQRIAYGSRPVPPFQTLSHRFGTGPSNKTLLAIAGADQEPPIVFHGVPDLNLLQQYTATYYIRQAPSQRTLSYEHEMIDIDMIDNTLEDLRTPNDIWSRVMNPVDLRYRYDVRDLSEEEIFRKWNNDERERLSREAAMDRLINKEFGSLRYSLPEDLSKRLSEAQIAERRASARARIFLGRVVAVRRQGLEKTEDDIWNECVEDDFNISTYVGEEAGFRAAMLDIPFYPNPSTPEESQMYEEEHNRRMSRAEAEEIQEKENGLQEVKKLPLPAWNFEEEQEKMLARKKRPEEHMPFPAVIGSWTFEEEGEANGESEREHLDALCNKFLPYPADGDEDVVYVTG